MAKKKKRNSRASATPEKHKMTEADKRRIYGNLFRLLCLIAVTMVVFCIYRFFINRFYFELVLFAYMAICATAVIAYVIYNRGFSRKGLTPEMLPSSMSDEEKQEFIADGERRIKKSRPLLIVIFAFAFTFIIDIIELFAIPMFKGLIGK